MSATRWPLFLSCPPGLEPFLAEEAAEAGFAAPRTVPGGVETSGGWAEVRRACLTLRGPSRVLVRLHRFRAPTLEALAAKARALPWEAVLRRDVPVRVTAEARRSRVWHEGAAAERIADGVAHRLGGAPGAAEDAEPLRLLARMERDVCTVSLDASGAPLHLRGLRPEVGAAPLRETAAALLLRAAGWAPGVPLVDPMCGSGAFVLEAAERAAGLAPGRARAFDFERLAGHDAGAWAAERAAAGGVRAEGPRWFHGSDHDARALEAAQANAAAAGLGASTGFRLCAVSALTRPEALADAPPGWVAVNPPWGARMGDVKALRALHVTLGRVLRAGFPGWRVALLTAAPELARASGLPFRPPGPPVPLGPIRARLFVSAPL